MLFILPVNRQYVAQLGTSPPGAAGRILLLEPL